MALDYPDASFTLPGQPIQGAGWTQLQGWNYACNCIGWDQGGDVDGADGRRLRGRSHRA